jgi:hypothetical protein
VRIARLLPAAFLAVLATASAQAGRIADLFSEGLFGLKWGATREEIDTAFPGGKWETVIPVTIYWVSDTRRVLNIERCKESRLGFVLNSEGRMNSVIIEFAPCDSTDRFAELLLKSQEAFGPMLPVDMERVTRTSAVMVEWEFDQGVKVTAGGTSEFNKGAMTLSISKVNFDPPKTKEELGFN